MDKFIIKLAIEFNDQLGRLINSNLHSWQRWRNWVSIWLIGHHPPSQVMKFLIYKLVANLIVFAPWGASCRESVQEAKLEVFGRAFKYVISKNIMDAIFLIDSEALVEGFYGKITLVNTDLLPHINRLKLGCKKYDYLLLWKNREVNAHVCQISY